MPGSPIKIWKQLLFEPGGSHSGSSPGCVHYVVLGKTLETGILQCLSPHKL